MGTCGSGDKDKDKHARPDHTASHSAVPDTNNKAKEGAQSEEVEPSSPSWFSRTARTTDGLVYLKWDPDKKRGGVLHYLGTNEGKDRYRNPMVSAPFSCCTSTCVCVIQLLCGSVSRKV